MKINDELYVLDLPMNFGGHVSVLNVSLISDKEHGLTLVDTGMPGQIELIEQALQGEGFSLDDIKQIVLTHGDIDHIGSLAALKEHTNATVYALAEEVPYIDGSKPSVKAPSPERLKQMPEFAAVLAQLKRTTVDVAVHDGEAMPKSAGAVAVATPGHTPGHMSLYLPASKSLITGDALTSDGGTLNGPMPMATPDMKTAGESSRKLADLDVETIVCYHGGLVTQDSKGQLSRVAESA